MKRFAITLALVAVCLQAGAKDIVKKGYNFGPLPAIAFDNDKGVQLGGILQIFNYGDGSNYPNYDAKWYIEGSYFTKGSQQYQLQYDDKTLIPGVRWSSAFAALIDNAMDFYGFNGYGTDYNYARVEAGKKGGMIYTPFYKMSRNLFQFKTDFSGFILPHFKWEVGYHFAYAKIGSSDMDKINKGKKDEQKFVGKTLYEYYVDAGLISDRDKNGGFTSGIWAGLMYDSRDKEGAPTRGIWAEGHINFSPKWLGSTVPTYRYSLTFRHYVPIVKNDVLTFAYRLNYEGTFGNNAPFYALPFITLMGENIDKDGMGGYRTCRGLLRSRVVGLDMATYTAEFRWRFVNFQLWNQNMAFGLSVFSDGTMATRQIPGDYSKLRTYGLPDGTAERLHATIGAGLRFIMNENFIVAFEYGMPISRFMKHSPIFRQDGDGAFYVNVGYLF